MDILWFLLLLQIANVLLLLTWGKNDKKKTVEEEIWALKDENARIKRRLKKLENNRNVKS